MRKAQAHLGPAAGLRHVDVAQVLLDGFEALLLPWLSFLGSLGGWAGAWHGKRDKSHLKRAGILKRSDKTRNLSNELQQALKFLTQDLLG